MRALIRDQDGVRLIPNHPEPLPAKEEAIVRSLVISVGGLDVEASRGLFGFQGVLGHEFVGVVESVHGSTGKDLAGRRVVGSIVSSCLVCDLCQAGLRAHCRERTLLGLIGRDGCCADRFSLPASNLMAVPDSVDDDHAVFAQVLASAIQARRQLTIEGKPYITVLGDGPLGLLTAQIMAKLNASVRVVGRYSRKLGLCEKWGVRHRHVDDVGRRADQDVVVDCTGSPHGLELALQLVRPRGKVLLKTMTAPSARLVPGVDLTLVALNEVEIIGSFLGPLREALDMLARREVDVVSLISKRMSLNDGPNVLRAASEPESLKVLVSIGGR